MDYLQDKINYLKIMLECNFNACEDQEVIKNEIKNNEDFFGFRTEILVDFLTWDNCKEYYKDEFVKDVDNGNKPEPVPTTTLEAIEEMIGYLDFALGKALDQRGISASRSITKLAAWLWVLGNEDIVREFENAEYAPYGAPKLLKLCELLGISANVDENDFSL